jgi:hypothetical protein
VTIWGRNASTASRPAAWGRHNAGLVHEGLEGGVGGEAADQADGREIDETSMSLPSLTTRCSVAPCERRAGSWLSNADFHVSKSLTVCRTDSVVILASRSS